MKKVYLLAIGTLLVSTVVAQKVAPKDNMGIGTVAPDQSAILDIQSTNKGLLIPRLTIEQRNNIATPANGLMVYQTNDKSGFYYYNGDAWKPMSTEDAKSVATLDINGWALDGNATATANKAAATSNSFIGTPVTIPIKFKIGVDKAGEIGLSNLFLGHLAGNNISSGISNSGFGVSALFANTTGSHNFGMGRSALSSNTTGSFNVAIGNSSLNLNTSGQYNVAIGNNALRAITVASNNVAVGVNSLYNTTGANNTTLGAYTLYHNEVGSRNIAMGTFAGNYKRGDGNIYIGYFAGGVASLTDESNKLYIANSNTTMPLVYGDFSAKYVTIGDVTPALRSQGTATGGYNLLVKGGILTEKVKVALAAAGTDWADYVFEPEYKSKMMSLEEVEKFTLENKHLPNVPSAEEMIKSGLDVSQTSKMFMEKIEELTLYLIELNKEVKALKAENNVLKEKK